MDRQNFEAKDRYPLSTQALTFMQDMVMATARLALIGGDHYILSGCAVSGNNVADGVIVIHGEVMPFKGGTVVPTITIVEEVVQVSANGLTFENARTKRYAKFATGTGANYYSWANFKQLQTNKQLEEAKATVKYVDDAIAGIQAGSIPTGVIVMWSGSVSDIPKGWQLCDNSVIPGTTKRTPDLRGRFVVGFNNDDSDYKTVGKIGGEKQVAIEEKHLPKHKHSLKDYCFRESWDVSGFDGYDLVGKGDGNQGIDNNSNKLYYKNHDTNETGQNVAHENRPPYYVLAFLMKIDVKN